MPFKGRPLFLPAVFESVELALGSISVWRELKKHQPNKRKPPPKNPIKDTLRGSFTLLEPVPVLVHNEKEIF